MATSGKPAIALRPMLPQDAVALAAIFVAGIEELTGDDYDANQQSAWSSMGEDMDAFAGRLKDCLTLVATIGGEPAGFASLKGSGHIEMLYVHPAAVGQGVAASLVDALEKLAAARQATILTVDASDTAQGFFARRGYTAKMRKTVQVGDEWLGTTGMEKSLAPAADRQVH